MVSLATPRTPSVPNSFDIVTNSVLSANRTVSSRSSYVVPMIGQVRTYHRRLAELSSGRPTVLTFKDPRRTTARRVSWFCGTEPGPHSSFCALVLPVHAVDSLHFTRSRVLRADFVPLPGVVALYGCTTV